MSKKNIDKLFQEKFKDFGEVPDDKVWNTIEASLNKKRKKRVIPLWWKLGGVAAVLALALLIWNPLSNDTESSPTITRTDGQYNNGADSNSEGGKDAFQLPETTNEILVEKATDEQSSEAESNGKAFEDALIESVSDGADKEVNATETQLAGNDRSSVKEDGTTSNLTDRLTNAASRSKNSDSKDSELATTEKRTNKNSGTDQNSILKKDVSNIVQGGSNEAIANTSSAEPENIPSDSTSTVSENKSAIAKMQKTEQNQNPKEDIAAANKTKVAQNDPDTIVPDTADPKKKSIFEAIEAQNEETRIAEKSQGRWSAGPSVAPVYFNAVGEGSPVHSIFAPNSKSGNTNLSYGLSVAYAVNKKLRIRSGVHRVDYGYDTDGVEFSSSLETASSERIANIDYTTTAKNLVVKSRASTSASAEAPTNDALAFEVSSADNASRNGTMAQQFGYLEVPLELDYAILDRKFGINLIGGFSSLFLLDNSVTVNSGDLTTEIGEANNVNNVNFSTNVGFGLNYRFSQKIRLNIEPVFKYQLNTFSDVAGDFRPFSVGVYSGLNFRF